MWRQQSFLNSYNQYSHTHAPLPNLQFLTAERIQFYLSTTTTELTHLVTSCVTVMY